MRQSSDSWPSPQIQVPFQDRTVQLILGLGTSGRRYLFGDMCWEVWVLPHTPGWHHFFLPISSPGPSRAASPPGPGKETAPAHLPVPREQCSPCCQQPFGHASPLMPGFCSAAQRPTPTPSFPFSTYVVRRRASGGGVC